MLLVALSAGACSTSFKLGNLMGDEKAERTASVPPSPAAAQAAPDAPSEADLAIAKLAAAEVLARGGKDVSQSWENPRTGARGSVTPIAAAYEQNGAMCHDFLASYVRGAQEAWYQGDACRSGGRWVVRGMRPLQRT